MNGILRPSEEEIHIVKMIFEGEVPQKDYLSQSYGTFVLCKGVYNARRITTTAWDKETNTLEVIIDLTREKVGLKRPAQFSFSIQINDCGLQGNSCTGGGANRGGCCNPLCCKKLYTLGANLLLNVRHVPLECSSKDVLGANSIWNVTDL